jgi:hypothetical protein
MSRIIQDRINAGESIDATDLNSRYTAYSQPGALDVANHGAASIDLPQVRGNQLITIDSQRVVLGGKHPKRHGLPGHVGGSGRR